MLVKKIATNSPLKRISRPLTMDKEIIETKFLFFKNRKKKLEMLSF